MNPLGSARSPSATAKLLNIKENVLYNLIKTDGPVTANPTPAAVQARTTQLKCFRIISHLTLQMFRGSGRCEK